MLCFLGVAQVEGLSYYLAFTSSYQAKIMDKVLQK